MYPRQYKKESLPYSLVASIISSSSTLDTVKVSTSSNQVLKSRSEVELLECLI